MFWVYFVILPVHKFLPPIVQYVSGIECIKSAGWSAVVAYCCCCCCLMLLLCLNFDHDHPLFAMNAHGAIMYILLNNPRFN